MGVRTLIIPDIHNRCETAERIVKIEQPDQTIFLGDYFDDFGDDPHTIAETATWFSYSVNQPNRIHLCGNHDLHYWFNKSKRARCGGYDQFKDIAINDIVNPKDWEKLKFFHVLDDKWVLSHAGVHPSWLDPRKFQRAEKIKINLEKLVKRLKRDSEEFLVKVARDEWHWFLMPGFSRSRGHSPYYGGLLWCDFEKEFHPIRGIHQIVGHTPSANPTWKFLKKNSAVIQCEGLGVVPKLSDETSYNLCLDTNNRDYAIYEDGKLSIIPTSSLKGP